MSYLCQNKQCKADLEKVGVGLIEQAYSILTPNGEFEFQATECTLGYCCPVCGMSITNDLGVQVEKLILKKGKK